MKELSLILALAMAAHAQWPPRGTIGSASGSSNGVSYRFAMAVEPASSDRQWANVIGEGIQVGKEGQHRFLWDSRNHLYFGYDLVGERVEDSGKCRVTISPLSLKAEDFLTKKEADRASYQLLSLPTYPIPQIVGPSDTIAVDLLVKPDGTQKLVDYIRVSCKGGQAGAVPETTAARDFSVKDAELRMVDPALTVNGTRVESADLRGDVVGNILWFHVPGKGQFQLSLAPHRNEGFVLAGTIRRNEISFRSGEVHYEIRSAEPIFQSEQVWNLYVKAEAASPSNMGAAFGASSWPALLHAR
jgi:hypothetical protein